MEKQTIRKIILGIVILVLDGKLSEVGPADYQTKNGDKIEWKIEKY